VTPDTEQYFNNFFELFNTPGWKQLTEELKENAININNASAISTLEDLHFRKGQLNMLSSLVNLPETVEANYKEATSQESEESALDYA